MANEREIGAIQRRTDAGFTLLEVMTAIAVMVIAIFPLIDAIKHSRISVRSSEIRRTMKQLMDQKMSQILLDQPPEDQEPIYVDGAEGNFGSEFDNDKAKSYWHDEKYYNYSYRIDSEEVDLSDAGLDPEEDEQTRRAEEEKRNAAPKGDAGSLFGGGAEGGEAEESKSQLRYRVTLTVFYRTGNPRLDQSMSAVTYVKHPREKETMSGPQAQGGAAGNGVGGLGEMQAGGGKAVNGAGIGTVGGFQSITGGNKGGAAPRGGKR